MVLTNRSGDMNPVPVMIAYNVYDRLLGLDPVDWNARNLELRDEQRARAEKTRREQEAKRVSGTQPSHALADYAGNYEHAGYGGMAIQVRDGGLVIVYEDFELDLEHFHYDIFRITSPPNIVPVTGLVTFTTNADGVVAAVAIPFEPNGTDIVFERAGS